MNTTNTAEMTLEEKLAHIMIVPVWALNITGKTARAYRDGWTYDGEEIARVEEVLLDFDLMSNGDLQWSLKTFYLDPRSPDFGHIDHATGTLPA